MKLTLTTILAIAGLSVASSAQAANILCSDVAKNYMTMGSSQASSCAKSGVGNIGNDSNDDFLNSLIPPANSAQFRTLYTERSDNSGVYGLTYDKVAGTWSFNSSFWTTYTGAAIGFKFGTGNTADEWFVFNLVSNVSSGNFLFHDVLAPGNKDNTALSHVVLYSYDAPRQQVTEPETLALLGFGLLGVGLARRRRLGA